MLLIWSCIRVIKRLRYYNLKNIQHDNIVFSVVRFIDTTTDICISSKEYKLYNII